MNDLISRKEAIETINSLTVSVSGVDVFPPEGKKSVIETLDLLPGIPLHNKWISVRDRLPEEETEVLCYLGNALWKGIVVAFRRHGDWYFDGWKCPTVTHWMPLPEPPKEES